MFKRNIIEEIEKLGISMKEDHGEIDDLRIYPPLSFSWILLIQLIMKRSIFLHIKKISLMRPVEVYCYSFACFCPAII